MVLGSLGSHKVGQRPLGCSIFFDHLLTQHVEGGLNAGAGFVGEDVHGVSVAIGRENPIHSAGSDALSGDQVIEQRLRIGEEFLGLFAILLMLQNGRIAPAQFPGVEERRPVDVGPERFERNVFQDANSGEFGVGQV